MSNSDTALNQISAKERENCELFYISHVSKIVPFTEEEIIREHPRWKELLASM
jgi:tubulin-specific chaperone E